ncbi:hypothetical protein ACN9ML_08550 [Dyadobacter endophyticus]
MVDFKKMDEQDLVVVNKKLTNKEEQAFSAFLKSQKSPPQKNATLKSARQ